MSDDVLAGKTKHDDNTDREKRELTERANEKKEKQSKLQDYWREVLSTEAGRGVIFNILAARLSFVSYTYRPGMSETDMAVSVGRREAGIELVTFLEAHYPRWFKLMMKENL